MGLFRSTPNAGRSRLEKPSRSNVRGRISGPMPIQEDETSNQYSAPEAQQMQPDQADPTSQQVFAVAPTNTLFNTAQGDNINSAVQSGPSQSSIIPGPVRQRTSPPVILINSTMREGTDRASPSGRKPTLKEAIGKLFGKRNKKQVKQTAPDSRTQPGPSNYHRRGSDLTAVKRGAGAAPEADRKRSETFPVTEFNKALRSHSIGPDDYRAIHSVRSSFQSGPAFKGRRAASISQSAISSKLPNESLDVLGLSPRPASHHAIDDPESIGRAVSIDAPASHRRSRSLPQLQDVEDDQVVHVRKRSDELRFWRESYNPRLLSPDLSVFNREDLATLGTLGTTETRETVETVDTVQRANGSRGENHPMSSPPQSFLFEPRRTTEITPVASLEDRMTALEVRNQKLERLVAQLFQVVSGVDSYPSAHERPGSIEPTAPPTPSTPMGLADTGRSVSSNATHDTEPALSSYSVSEPSEECFGDGKEFIGSTHPSTIETTRPISTTTVRRATSPCSLRREGPVTPDQFANMKALLDAERAERHALELRVAKLTQLVNMLTRMTHKPDDKPPLVMQPTVSIFEYDDDDDDDNDHDHEAELPGTYKNAKLESVECPGTEPQVHDGAIQDIQVQDEVNAASMKRRGGTFSLDHLTLGKPENAQQQNTVMDL